MMTDAELIAAVAKKAGWTHIHTYDLAGNNMQIMGIPPGAKTPCVELPLPPWLTSVDACLKLLDKTFPTIAMTRLSGIWTVLLLVNTDNSMVSKKFEAADESLPRAILLAWLEA